MTTGSSVTICDVGPRDGLQNESRSLAPDIRAELCRRLAAAGVPIVEAVSFVNPARVPQMAGAEEVVGLLDRQSPTAWAGLVLNQRGLDRAIEAGLRRVHYAFPVTETFAARNQGSTVDDSIREGHEIVRRARIAGIHTTVIVGAAFGCPFEGEVDEATVLRVIDQTLGESPDHLVLADTIGAAVPGQVSSLVRKVAEMNVPLGAHFHNTRNTGYANALTALEYGCVSLDASLGGSGGCPFAPNATGNIATEDLVYMLHRSGVATGIDLEKLVAASLWLGAALGEQLPGMVARAPMFPSSSVQV
jgi:isopropylmalate/homocitrate/citramalate synthase